MTNEQLFIALIHRLADYEEAMVLQLLLTLDADRKPLRSGKRKLQQSLGASVSVRGAERAVSRLVAQGLITTKVYPNTYTEYTVNVESLEELLADPLEPLKWLPGVSQEPIHFLTTRSRLQSDTEAVRPSPGDANPGV
jgi:hypothetical protein